MQQQRQRGLEQDYAGGQYHLERYGLPIIRNALAISDIEIVGRDDLRDIREATDLVATTPFGPITIGARVRDIKYGRYFHQDFTMVYRRKSGVKVEYQKIMYDGHCDFYFYGISDLADKESGIDKYGVYNCDVFRKHRQWVEDLSEVRTNDEGTQFICIPWSIFPHEFFLDKSF